MPSKESSYPCLGSGENEWSTVAVDDLATLYVLALHKGRAGTLFHATAGEPVSIRSIAEAVSRNIGAGGATRSWALEEAHQQLGLVAGGISANMRASSDVSKRILGWQPTIIRALVSAGGAWRDWRGQHGDYAHPLAKAVQSWPGIAESHHLAPLRTGV